ncbi:DEAD/DEAH box helicase [Mesobacillus selenatarsenatis]|uniref:AAA family ATPase n=1 Tax=Mesobacillus selenatarsenatis TaxID=388741 RepID=A0A846TQI7_9BACI|nr:DEAD/DEAH box helicase [Mesobacillus selenatarsenatis]NKE07962.1 AAA family ATPase [Mesobacillus selenatarsenatis]
MKYIFGKAMLSELAGDGCTKKVIHQLHEKWPVMEDEETTDSYIEKQLKTAIPVKDKPPLEQIMELGDLAELLRVEELSNSTIVKTEIVEDFRDSSFFLEKDGKGILFNSDNRGLLKKLIEDGDIEGKHFKIALSEYEDHTRDEFKRIFDPNISEYVYQVELPANIAFVRHFLDDEEKYREFISKNITFTSMRPDLIRLIKPGGPGVSEVLSKKNQVVPTSGDKIILQICDVKMSDFRSGYFIELALYMSVLNEYIHSNGLENEYEVAATGQIFQQKFYETPGEREARINEGESQEVWECDYKTLRTRLKALFNEKVFSIIDIIEKGERFLYEEVVVTPMCQTCDYYGGQFSDSLRNHLKKINKRDDIDNSELTSYQKENNYCRYQLINKNSINTIPILKRGERRLLISENVQSLEQLGEELKTNAKGIFDRSLSLKAGKEELQQFLDLQESDEAFRKVKDQTLFLPDFTNLLIFIDIQHDPQDRTFSYAMEYFYRNGGESEDSGEDPYLQIVETSSVIEERREFLDFLLAINSLLKRFEDSRNEEGDPVTFAIVYWGANVIKFMERQFLRLVERYPASSDRLDDFLSDIYPGLSEKELLQKKQDIQELFNRFGTFFKNERELEHYKVIKHTPFYNLKQAIEDVYRLNVNYEVTLIKAANLLLGKDADENLYKPDSDQMNINVMISARKNLHFPLKVKTIKDELIGRIHSIKKLLFQTPRGLTQPPEIPHSDGGKEFPNLAFGADLLWMHLLNWSYDVIEKESVHHERPYKKMILGRAVHLEEEITGEDKKRIIHRLLNINVRKDEKYKVYKISDDSINADKEGIENTLYPADENESLFKLFTPKTSRSSLSITGDLADFIFMSYREAMLVAVKIVDKENQILIIDVPKPLRKLISHLEGTHKFDFSQNVLLETVKLTDFWIDHLSGSLEKLNDNPDLIKRLEQYDPVEKVSPLLAVTELTSRLENHYRTDPILKSKGHVDLPLDESQKNAIISTMKKGLSLLWGPPGTGKSHTIAHLLLYDYLLTKPDEIKRVLLLGNYDATDNLISNIIDVMDQNDVTINRIRSGYGEDKHYQTHNIVFRNLEMKKQDIEGIADWQDRYQIFSSTQFQISKLHAAAPDLKFDFIIVDEASQMEVGAFLTGLLFIKPETKILLAGDHKQLPPVTKIKVKSDSKHYFGSVFSYYHDTFQPSYPNILSVLEKNRRSNKVIVEYSRNAFDYPVGYQSVFQNDLISFEKEMDSSFYDLVLDPVKVMVCLSYEDGFSQKRNIFEAEEVVALVKRIFERRLMDRKTGKPYESIPFFEKGVGIAVPHNQQKYYIQNELMNYFTRIGSASGDELTRLKKAIENSVDTVEKYQGQQRDIIICSFTVGDTDFIQKEEEFIYSPHRLNVIISRAKHKAIILASNQLMHYTSNDYDKLILKLPFDYLSEYCDQQLYLTQPKWQERKGIMKFREA